MSAPAHRAGRAGRVGRAGRGLRADGGASSLELVLYMPLLLLVILITVQFSLIYLANQAAEAVARETARVARAGAGTPASIDQARARGLDYAAGVGHGVLLDAKVVIDAVPPRDIRVTVTGHGQQLVPGLPANQIVQIVQGPVEVFRPDS